MTKKYLTILSSLLLCLSVSAQSSEEPRKEVAKTGFGLGPLPRVGYDADNGFYAGLQLSLNDYRDGGLYPNPYSSGYVDVSYYQKGIFNLILSYDNRTLIPGARLCTALQYCDDHFYNFWGLNGYQANWSPVLFDPVTATPGSSPAGKFYGTHHRFVNFKVDAVGDIAPGFGWEAGYHLVWARYSDPQDEGYYGGNFLYTLYNKWGIIPEGQLHGGLNSELRVGLVYDTRDSEASPSRGMWAEGHLIAAPKWLGTSAPYYKFCLNWRHYVPICKDRLTFAYRLVYQGFFNNDAPWYIMPYYTVTGPQFDRDGVGGFRTLRGIMLCRIQGLQTAFFNTELRWRFWDFRLLRQNVSLCASGFFEGGQVVKPYDIGYGSHCAPTATESEKALYSLYIDTSAPDRMHLSAGGGLRFIFNRNFIIALEWGKALNATDSRFPNRNQDGGQKASFYFNTGFTF